LTGLVTRELAESTGAVGLADMEESASPTRVVGLADLATAERESAELTWSVPAWEKLNFHASTILEYGNYAHRHHSQMLIELTCWPFDFHAL
jgi:hypothetical protein